MEKGILLICISVIAGVIVYFIYKNQITKRKQYQKYAIDKTLENEYQKKCIYIFTKCREKKIDKFITDEDINNLKIIANSYEISDLEEAKKCYYLGQALVENVEEVQQTKVLEEERKRELSEFHNEERRSKVTGKEKYISSLEKIYRDALKKMKLSKDAPKDEKEKLSDINYNYEREDFYKDNTISEVYATVSAYNSAVKLQKKKIEDFNKKICDETNPSEKFKNLEFTNVKCLVLKSKNVRVSGFVKVKDDLKLLGSDALLDGSIKISILDSESNVLGYGFYSTGTFNDGLLIDSGFTKHEKRFSCICIIDDYEKMQEGQDYKYRIEPVNMWLIEC